MGRQVRSWILILFGTAALTILFTNFNLVCVHAADPMVGGAEMFAERNIVENAMNSKDHTTLVAAVAAAGLVDTLKGAGPFTVFAPVNAAFDALPAGTVDTLLKPENKDQLTKILTCHVVGARAMSDAVMKMVADDGGAHKVKTVGGCEITLKLDGRMVTVTDESGGVANVTIADVEQSNGIIHVIDKVLLPKEVGNSVRLRASRIFSGPEEYPPTNFSAYGIVVFKSTASSFDSDRHKMICEAYVNSLFPTELLGISSRDQMVTVWPIDSTANAKLVSQSSIDTVCETAVKNYGLKTAIQADREAKAAGVELDGAGPFLIAWSPPSAKGMPDAIVLKADMSELQSYQEIRDVMHAWVNDIESNPELWKKGWNAKIHAVIQKWLDHHGSKLLTVIGLEGK